MEKNEYPLKHPRGSSPRPDAGQPARRSNRPTNAIPVEPEKQNGEEGASMISARMIWNILQRYVPRKRWVPSEDIYAIVALHGELEGIDLQPQSSRTKTPRWKVRVRNVLANRLKRGRVRWRERTARQDDQGVQLPM